MLLNLLHWKKQAEKYGISPVASWKDELMIDIEINLINKFLNKNMDVLDVGCANGFSALKQANFVRSITGIDNCQKMIEGAKEALFISNKQNVAFDVGDIRDIRFEDNTFDVVYTTRVLINLPNWRHQKKAIGELLRVCKTGGKVIILEAFVEPLENLNMIRRIFNLKSLTIPEFNRYLVKEKLNKFLNKNKIKYQNIDHSSVYYVGSRLLREMRIDKNCCCEYVNPFNQIIHDASIKINEECPIIADLGIQQAYILEKGE
jgi:ubiquinone/menaquinone biosynthesis C-methylase UbiE